MRPQTMLLILAAISITGILGDLVLRTQLNGISLGLGLCAFAFLFLTMFE